MGASSDIQLGIRLTADSKGLVGEVRVSKAELDKLTGATRATGVAAQEAAGRTGALTSSLGKLAAGMAAGMLEQRWSRNYVPSRAICSACERL